MYVSPLHLSGNTGGDSNTALPQLRPQAKGSGRDCRIGPLCLPVNSPKEILFSNPINNSFYLALFNLHLLCKEGCP